MIGALIIWAAASAERKERYQGGALALTMHNRGGWGLVRVLRLSL